MNAPVRDIPRAADLAWMFHPGRLWSLLDMLDAWGHRFVGIGTELGYLEVDLQSYRRAQGGSVIGHGTITLDPKEPAAVNALRHLDQLMRLTEDLDDEFGTIARRVRILHVKFAKASPHHDGPVPLYLNDVLDAAMEIKKEFLYLLEKRKFYYIQPGLLKLYGQPELFGAAVAKKFPRARRDIERAGNCLALGEPTACVLHLNRAMEIATHRLAKKLKVTLHPKDTWGMVLGKMNDPIRNLPDDTEARKRRKEKWAECRTNLYHVKMGWRDPGAHGTQNYDHKEADDILKKVGDFMQQLATLL
jgi:hypothetical protein